MEGGAALEGVFGGCLVVYHLFTTVDQPLLNGRNTLLLFDLLLDLGDLVGRLDIELDLLAREGAHLDLHLESISDLAGGSDRLVEC